MKLLIWANNFLRSTGLATLMAITVTFCSLRNGKKVRRKKKKGANTKKNIIVNKRSKTNNLTESPQWIG